MKTPPDTAATHTDRCSCVCCVLLGRFPAGDAWRRSAQGLGRSADLREMPYPPVSLQGQAAQAREWSYLHTMLQGAEGLSITTNS